MTQPADFGLVGICAMLGASTHAPLTSIFLLSELAKASEVVWLRPDDDLARTERLFQSHGFEQIPVLATRSPKEGGGMEVVGILHHTDLTQAAARRRLAMELPR